MHSNWERSFPADIKSEIKGKWKDKKKKNDLNREKKKRWNTREWEMHKIKAARDYSEDYRGFGRLEDL